MSDYLLTSDREGLFEGSVGVFFAKFRVDTRKGGAVPRWGVDLPLYAFNKVMSMQRLAGRCVRLDLRIYPWGSRLIFDSSLTHQVWQHALSREQYDTFLGIHTCATDECKSKQG